jgi:medium-chain acyl-[acyl-carrier-protein] hydrolase
MKKNGGSGGWIESLDESATVRLFCFPHVGGTSAVFRAWSTDGGIDICPVQLPGREKRLMERPFDRLRPLVQTMARVLPFDKPFAFFGHSLGALVSFELARELRRQNRQGPAHLFLSAHAAPQLPSRHPEPRHLWPDVQLIEELRRLGGTHELILQDTSLMRMLLPMLRADFALNETYCYGPEKPLRCPIAAFGGEQDLEVNEIELAGWREHTEGDFTLRMFPGDHFYLNSAKSELLQQISSALGAGSVNVSR